MTGRPKSRLAAALQRIRSVDPFAQAALPAQSTADGKVADLTGPGITDRWGVTATDLGATVRAPNGKLVAVFGDTFTGRRVGRGDWRSPVVLIGTGDARTPVVWERAGGPDPDYARQLRHYIHDTGPLWASGGISTVLPSDLLSVGGMLYLHVIVNRGYPHVIWTEIWSSRDCGVTWEHMGERAKFPADLHDGHAQLWSWDYSPDDDWVYVASTGFQRDKGVILRRVRPRHLGERSKYLGWGRAGHSWEWGVTPTPITPADERWGELSFRRLDDGNWVLGGFLASAYALGYRVLPAPTTPLGHLPVQSPVHGCSWEEEHHAGCRVAQLYGGHLLPGSKLNTPGGIGLVVSHWNTSRGWPYRVMQFRATLRGP
jgi:D-arabinan endo alpha-(1,5)-arabinofuranosidase